jgi:hypothetical protein
MSHIYVLVNHFFEIADGVTCLAMVSRHRRWPPRTGIGRARSATAALQRACGAPGRNDPAPLERDRFKRDHPKRESRVKTKS